MVAGRPLVLTPQPAVRARWESEVREDPFAVSLAEKGDLLEGVTRVMRDGGADMAEASSRVWQTHKGFASSEGSLIEQRITECGAAMSATAVGERETQRRSYPGIRGQYGTRGWELVRELDLPGNAPRIAAEARALLTADACPSLDATDLILGSEQMALQIHESVGHATELDRILGWEASFAGTSWLDLAQLGTLRFGSDLMTITADATLPGALGSFGYDDEGTPAQPVDIVRDGIWVGVLSGRDSAAVAGLTNPAARCARTGFDRLPMVRMTNVGLLPGSDSLEAMIAATDDGILMDTNRSWSIDDKRLNFQFGCEIGWEIKGGKRGRMLRNPTYTGISPRFWGSMDMLATATNGRSGARPTAARGSRCRSATPGTRRCRRGSGASAWGSAGERRRREAGRRGGRGAAAPGPERDGTRPRRRGERVLALVGRASAGAEAEVSVRLGRDALTRFANSRIHQNMDGESSQCRAARGRGRSRGVRVAGRAARPTTRWRGWWTTRWRRRGCDRWTPTGRASRRPSRCPRWTTGMTRPRRPRPPIAPNGWRTSCVRRATWRPRATAPPRRSVIAFANSAGHAVVGRSTSADMDGIARTATSDGAARAASVRLADLDGAAVGERAASKARSSADAQDSAARPVRGDPGAAARRGCARASWVSTGSTGVPSPTGHRSCAWARRSSMRASRSATTSRTLARRASRSMRKARRAGRWTWCATG